MRACDLNIIPEGVELLEGDELEKKITELCQKGVLSVSRFPDGDIFYIGTVIENSSNNKYEVHIVRDLCAVRKGGWNFQYGYLGSDNRVYPADNDKKRICRLIIDC